MPECLLRPFGCEDLEFSDDCSGNIGKLKRLISICNIYIYIYKYNRYHHFYNGAKGNQFKNKYVLIEGIHKMKNEQKREKELKEQQDARRLKNQLAREKKNARKQGLEPKA